MGGYPDWREDEQPVTAPVDAGDATADQAVPVAEPTVQSTAPAEQPGATEAATGAPANVTTATPTLSPLADTPEGFDMPLVTPPPSHGIPVGVQEMQQRQRATEERERALANAARRDSASAAALKDAKDRAPSVVDQYIDHQLAPLRAAGELGKGIATGAGEGISGIGTFLAVAQKGAQDADLQRMKEIDAGGRPRFDDSDRVKFYFRSPEKRQEERENLERAAAVPLGERWLYKNGKAAGDWLKIEQGDPRYETLYNIGKEGGKLLVAAPVIYISPSLGAVIMIGMETGSQTNDAIDEIEGIKRDAGIENLTPTEEDMRQLVGFNQRGVLRNSLTSLPFLKVAGAAGGNYVMRVIQQKAGPGWARAMGVAGEAGEGAASAGLGKFWENADARDSFNPGRALNDGVGEAALAGGILGFAKAGVPAAASASRIQTQQLNRLHSNRYVEPETLRAENANTLASRAASLADTIRARRQAGDTRNFDELINERLGSGAKGYISPLKLNEMIEAGYFFDKKVESLGLREKIAVAREAGRDVELSMRDLVEGNNIRQNDIDEVMQNLKFEEGGPTGREAGKVLEERYKQLKDIEDRFGNAEPTQVEGGYAFSQIREEVKQSGRMKRSEVSRQAARRIEVLEERAREMSANGRRETADTVYLRDEYRKTQKLRRDGSSKEGQRLEDEYVATRLRELGIAAPGNKAGAPN